MARKSSERVSFRSIVSRGSVSAASVNYQHTTVVYVVGRLDLVVVVVVPLKLLLLLLGATMVM